MLNVDAPLISQHADDGLRLMNGVLRTEFRLNNHLRNYNTSDMNERH